MNVRISVSLCAFAAIIIVASCSSGLGNNLKKKGGPAPSIANSNLPVGLDIGVTLDPMTPVGETVVAGVVVPAIGANTAREIVLVAFTTAADAANGDGNGTAISRDTVTDGNNASDVFVAAISAQDVERRAFSQSLAGKFRHPRCVTCHSMQAADTTAFATVTEFPTGHAGTAPGPGFPNNDPSTCAACHSGSTSFPVPGWQAPAASFDLRKETVAEIAARAQNIPADETEHFVSDPRVLWALDSGILPTFGGRNGVADDDHDGVDEPEDRDGIVRTVPGGSAAFLQEIEDWRASGMVVTAAAAVKDITLVSRATGMTAAGDGASTAPQVLYVPNGSFTAPGRVGTLYVVYQSDATNLVVGDGNGVSDVFRTAIDLNSDAAGNLDLVVSGNAVLCSAQNGTDGPGVPGDRASSRPVIGGDGRWVAFESLASDLATFTDNNGAASHDVFVRDIDNMNTLLVSHVDGDNTNGGNGGSQAPSIDATGVAIAFESDATDLIAGDTNGARDVYYARTDGASPFVRLRASVSDMGAQGTGGGSSNASIYTGGGRTLVAFQSDASNLAASLTATTNVFLFDSNSGATTLLNQRVAPTGNAIGDGSARNAVIGPDGAAVAFESDATNIDVLRADSNRTTDVFLVETAQIATGNVLPYRFSTTAAEAAEGDGASTNPRFGTFATASGSFGVGFATFATAATNLGTSDTTNVVVAFLDETSGVLADLTATPTSGPAPLTVQFTDRSSGNPTTWAWDFDNDGNVDSTEQNPSFVYTTPGMLSVKLVASNQNSSGETTKANLIRVIGPVVPDFTATPTSVTTTEMVTFTDTSTEQPNAWSWDFGDGSALSTAQNPTHAYTTPGTYSVTLTATNEVGPATVTKSDLIQVFEPVVAGFTPPTASGTVPFTVNFTNTSTGATSYVWDFGDGVGTSTDPSPMYEYTSASSPSGFTVTLTAIGPVSSGMATGNVIAFGSVAANFTISTPNTNQSAAWTNQVITLDASTSTGPITLYEWDFDNNFSTVEVSTMNAVLNNVNVGTNFPTTSETTYPIRLRVSNGGGASAVSDPQNFTSVAEMETTNPPINATQDTTIYSGTHPVNGSLSNNGNGASTRLIVGNTYQAGFRRALLKFDISPAVVPAQSTILAARLRLTDISPTGVAGLPYHTGDKLTGTQMFNIHRVTTAWAEGTGTATGQGGPNGPGGATFSTMGANWDPTVSGTITFMDPVTTPSVMYQTFVTPPSLQLRSDVSTWVNSPASNFGWTIKDDPETATTATATIKWFESSESTNKPTLEVTFRRPLP